MLEGLRQGRKEVPEHRSGRNIQYAIADAGLGAFSVFYMQSPSFLAHQRDMQRKKGQNNAQGLFGVERTPSDGQIRNLLDPVEPRALYGQFWEIYRRLDECGYLEAYRWMDRNTSRLRRSTVHTVGCPCGMSNHTIPTW